MTNGDFFGVSKANKRAVEEAAEAIRKAGMKVVPVTLPNFNDIVLDYIGLQTCEGGMRSLFDSAEGEKLIDEYKTLVLFSKIPRWVRRILSPLLRLVGH
jgi:hypothetical protein